LKICDGRHGDVVVKPLDVIASDDQLIDASSLYWDFVAANPGRVVLLCDRACVLARSHRFGATTELAVD
jgi:hypothetical protein